MVAMKLRHGVFAVMIGMGAALGGYALAVDWTLMAVLGGTLLGAGMSPWMVEASDEETS